MRNLVFNKEIINGKEVITLRTEWNDIYRKRLDYILDKVAKRYEYYSSCNGDWIRNMATEIIDDFELGLMDD